MKIIFMGCTKFSEAMLVHLFANDFKIEAILTIPEKFHISYSPKGIKNFNHADLTPIAKQYGIPCYEVNSTLGKRITDYSNIIQKVNPDLLLAVGWYYMVPENIRKLAKYGAWGIHASLLPNYAGGAPLVWAMINGEKETGVTLFQLGEGVDDGDIIDQKSFPIGFEDTIKEVYEKAIEGSKEILIKALAGINEIQLKPQKETEIRIYPQRKPEEGVETCDLSGRSR